MRSFPFTKPDFPKLQQPANHNAPFVDREAGKKVLIEAAEMNLMAAKEKKTTKQEYSVVCIVGGAGTGKTRACAATGTVIRKHLKTRVFEVYLDFSNGDKLIEYEKEVMPSQIMGLRLFVKLFSPHTTVEKFVAEHTLPSVKSATLQGEFDLLKVFGEFVEAFKKEYSEQAILCVCCDEYQFTIQTLGETNFTNPFRSLCELISTSPNPDMTILPVVAGTLPENTVKFSVTDFNSIFFPLPLFQLQTILQLANEAGVPSKFFQTNSLRRFWAMVGMVPRALQFAIAAVKQGSINSIAELYSAVNKRITITYPTKLPYSDSSAHDKQLLSYAITGRPISENEQWIIQLAMSGQLLLTVSKCVALPYFTFRSLLDEHLADFVDVLPNHTADFTWQQFEQLFLLLTAEKMSTTTEATLGTLFAGHISKSIKNLKIMCQPRSVLQEKEKFFKGTKNSYKVLSLMPSSAQSSLFHVDISSESLFQYVFQTVRNHLLVDGRLFVRPVQFAEQQIVILIQCKLRSEGSTTGDNYYDPRSWAKFMQTAVQEFTTNKIFPVLVYVTNALISDAKEIVEQHHNLIIIDQAVLSKFFSPMIYPYVANITLNPEHDEEDEDTEA